MRDRIRKGNPRKEYDHDYMGAKIDEILTEVNETKKMMEKGNRKQERLATFVFGYGVGFSAIGAGAALASIPTAIWSIYLCFGLGLETMVGYGLWYWGCRHQRWEK
jgi:hypothetical protein